MHQLDPRRPYAQTLTHALGRLTLASDIDTALTRVTTRLHAWHAERQQIAAEIRQLIGRANALLEELGGTAPSRAQRPPRSAKRRGGRPKGFKVSPATRAKLRAVWKRRKAEQEGKAKAA